jgi:hypothetical protein
MDSLQPCCLEVFESLQARGFHIRYLTARGWDVKGRVTREQLKRWGAPNPDDVIFVNSLEEKVEVLDNKICDFFVDDFTTGQENSIGTFR